MSVSRDTTSPRHGGRRTYLRADRRRAQILDVARSVFAERGYHEANVAHICEAARIGRGTLYQYFENKRDVLVAVVEEMCGRLQQVLERRPKVADLPGLGKAPVEMIVAFCNRRLRDVLDAIFVDEPTLRLLLRDARGLDGAVDEQLAKIDALLIGSLEGDLRAAQEAGVFRAIDAHLVALHILGGIEKIVLTALGGGEAIDLDAIVKSCVEFQLFGLLREEVRR